MISLISIILTYVEEESDKEFITRIFNEYVRLMMKTAGRYFCDESAKEDVVQDSLIKMIRHIDKLRKLDSCSLASYIVIIVRHTAVDHISKLQKENSIIDTISDNNCLLSVPDESIPLDEHIYRLDRIGKLTSVWPRLSESERVLLEGKYLLNFSDAELAQIIGCKTDSIRMMLTRARRHAMSELLEEGLVYE